jgi:hypothetical protein
MLRGFLSQTAAGALVALMLVPPRAAGRLFFQFAVGLSCALLLLGLALSAVAGSPSGAPTWLFAGSALGLLVAAGLFHTDRLAAGQAIMIPSAALAVAGVGLDAVRLLPAEGRLSAPLQVLDALTAGLLLGSILIAMVLGHYYLNIPGLSSRHLERLTLLALAAILARALVIAAGVAMGRARLLPIAAILLDATEHPLPPGSLDPFVLALLLLQISAGILAAGAFCFMAWRTSRIASTQSATGILYVALIVGIMGELAGRYIVALTRPPL